MTTSKQWTISPDVAYVDSGERVVVVDLAHLSADGPRILLGPAAEIWRAVVDTADEAEIVQRVTEHFDTDETQAAADIRQFLAGLAAQDLLVRRSTV